MSRLMVISSDGHVTARMPDYRDYLERRYHDAFDHFLETYRAPGLRDFDRELTMQLIDPEEYDTWIARNGPTGRMDGRWEPGARLTQMEAEGVVAEVLFPDLPIPFDASQPQRLQRQLAAGGDDGVVGRRVDEHVEAGKHAFNRWLAHYCRSAPDRFRGMAILSVHDPEAAVQQVRWAADAGLHGVIAPQFPAGAPVYSARYEPVWDALEAHELVLNLHAGISAISDVVFDVGDVPGAASAFAVGASFAYWMTRELLVQMIWGGVLERHPNLRVVLTELGSDWLVGTLMRMDHSYERSYLRRDIRDVIPRRPSEYFARQCYIGASTFSRGEVEHRADIGVDKLMIGVDYPHHEGTWGAHERESTQAYLRATFGAVGVQEAEARLMLGVTAGMVFKFDTERLAPIVARVGPQPDEVLVAPLEDRFPRGDVHRPFAT